MKFWAAGISLFLFAALAVAGPQTTAPGTADNSAKQTESATATPNRADAYYHFMLAQRYKDLAGIYNRGDYVDRAISEYKKAIQDDPTSNYLHVQLAELYWRISHIQDAITEAEGVLKKNPDDVGAHRLLAHIYLGSLSGKNSNALNNEMLQKTIAQFAAVYRLDPSDVESALMLGRLYKANGEPQKAEVVFKKVLDANPDSRNVLANLTELYFDEGHYNKIISLLENIPSSRMDPALLYLLGNAYSQNRQYDKAEASFKAALARQPESEDIRRAYAEALMSQGKMKEARSQLRAIVESDPQSAMSYIRLAQLDRQMGNFKEARQELEQAKNLAPDNLEIPYQEAILDHTVGDDVKAISLLQGVLQKTRKPDGKYNPAEANNRAVYLQRLGGIYRSQENYEKAIETYKRIVALGDDVAVRGESLIAETLQMDNQYKKSMQVVKAALQKHPQDHDLLMLRGLLLGQLGHPDEGVAQLKKMLDGTPDDREIDVVIAQIYMQAKEYPKAESVLQKALSLTSNPSEQEYARYMLGNVYYLMKKYDLAEVQFKKVLAIDPLNDAAANSLGYMLADRGMRLEESVKYIKDALKIKPNNGAYLDSLGWAYHKMNNNKMAQVPLQKAVELIPTDPTIREHLGYVYLGLGEKAKALHEWESALKFWHKGTSSDFSAKKAAKLRKQVNHLKHQIGQQEASSEQN